jgi:hypothetical protein
LSIGFKPAGLAQIRPQRVKRDRLIVKRVRQLFQAAALGAPPNGSKRFWRLPVAKLLQNPILLSQLG